MLDRVFTELFYWKEVAALLNFFLNDSKKKKIIGTSVSESLFQQDQEKILKLCKQNKTEV